MNDPTQGILKRDHTPLRAKISVNSTFSYDRAGSGK